MGMTDFPLNDPLAIQRWSTSLAVEAAKKQYFAKFIGTGPENLIVLKNELHKGAGDKVTVGLQMKLSEPGVEGDNIIEGHATGEEAISFFNDALFIDQLRKGTKSKGKMSEQRVPYPMRKVGRDALSVWWAEEGDEQIFFYLSGARGAIAASFHNPISWAGRANNALQAPDASHIFYAGDATGKADLDASDIIDLFDIERFVAKAETLDPMIQPFQVQGEKKFVCLMHTFQAFQLRTATSEQDWLAIHKATDSSQGQKSMIYKNAMGEYADVILHKHRNCVRFNDYGSGSDVLAARALFLGAQAGMIAYGQNSSPQRYSWNEETDDRGNALAITAGTIFAVKKSRYNNLDFGTIVFDSYCPVPA